MSTIYDAAGNVINDGTLTYTYDDEGRIISVDNGGTGTYVYNADGLRVHRVGSEGAEDYAYDLAGQAVTTILPGGGAQRREVYAGNLHVATYDDLTTFFDHADWQGTERVRSGVTGTSVETCSSLPYGDDLSCTGFNPSPAHFTGMLRDAETGLNYTSARYYSSNAGRWMLPDWSAVPEAVPYADLANPQTLNLYTYVGNNPINGIDADGHYNNGSNGQPCGWYGFTGGGLASTMTAAQVPCSAPNNSSYSADNGEGQEWASDTAEASTQGLAQQTSTSDIPSKFAIEPSKTENQGSYSTFYYQLENAKGQALTGNGYSVEEHISGHGSSLKTSEGQFVPATNGEVSDRVGYLTPPKVGTNQDTILYQTFTVNYSGANYNLTTVFKHETVVRTAIVDHHRVLTYINTVTDVVP